MGRIRTKKLLFIQGSTRVKEDNQGKWYSDFNFTDAVFARYKNLCGELTVILRKEEKIYEHSYAISHFNRIDETMLRLVAVEDCMMPRRNCLDMVLLKGIWKTIEREVKKADRVIIRSVLNFYTIAAARLCEKYQKEYLVEVTGYAFEGYITRGFPGIVLACPAEIIMKHYIKKAPYVLYVTEWKLQRRYPTKGISIGCSDVEIPDIDTMHRGQRKDKQRKLLLGTIGIVDAKHKGIGYAIKALYLLKCQGIDQIEYQIVGKGDARGLKKLAKRYGVEKQVKFCGVYRKEQIVKWLHQMDVYIQPSISEGLCRSIVEAMNAGCPVIATDAGGNCELIEPPFLVPKRNANAIAERVKMFQNPYLRKRQSKKNYQKSFCYRESVLTPKRNAFFEQFMRGSDES